MAYGLKWPPLGYLNNKETKQIYLNKEKAPLIKAFEAYAGKPYFEKYPKDYQRLGLERAARRFAFRFKFPVFTQKSFLLRHYPLHRQNFTTESTNRL